MKFGIFQVKLDFSIQLLFYFSNFQLSVIFAQTQYEQPINTTQTFICSGEKSLKPDESYPQFPNGIKIAAPNK